MTSHHIVVGDGLSAAEFATTCKPCPGDTITIIGPDVNNLGRGIAYAKAPGEAPWRYAYLLNSPARSVDPEFSEWLPANWKLLVECMSGRSPDWLSAAQPYVTLGDISSVNAPREIYGDFAHNRTMKKLDDYRDRGVHVQLLQTCVTEIIAEETKPEEPGLKVITHDGQQLVANSVDVATGGPQNQRFNGDDGAHSFPTLFGNEQQIADKLQKDGSIICIGASAAMLDCFRFCQSVQSESSINFTALSPSGILIPALRPSANFKPTHYELTGTFKCAEDFLDAIKNVQRRALDSGDSLYETRVGMRNLFMKTSLNEFVPNLIEARRVTLPLFKHFQGGTRDSIDDFNKLMATGNTRIVAGRVEQIEHQNDVASVHYSDITGQLKQLTAQVVVNCAGPGNQYRFDALTSNMLSRDWISICKQSGGILVGAGGKTAVKGVRYLGPAVTSIGEATEAVPLYDASRLRSAVQGFNASLD